MLIDFGAPAKTPNGRITVRERKLPAILHHYVVAKLVA